MRTDLFLGNIIRNRRSTRKGTIICYLLSDAAQIELWPTVQKNLTPGKALYFSHGFGITFNEQTGNCSSKDVDVFLVAPKGSGNVIASYVPSGRGLTVLMQSIRMLQVKLKTA